MIKGSRLWAIAGKEWLHLSRDWRSLGMGIMIPLTMLFMFSYALSLDVDRVPMVVWDQSQTPESREFISRFTGSRYFSLRGSFAGYSEMEKAIDTRAALIGLVIPSDFARKLQSGRRTDVQLIADATDSTTAGIALGYATVVTSDYSSFVGLRELQRKGIQASSTGLEIRPIVWFNPELESRNFIIPGLIAILMMVIAGLLTALTVAREWENGTMEQLIASPIQGPEIILGKLVPYFALGMFDMFLSIITGIYVFHVPFRGNMILLVLLSAIFLVGTLAVGMLVSVVAKKQLVANELAMLITFLPSFMLSGFIYTIANMPKFVQLISYLVPARYFIKILRGIYLKGIGLESLWFPALLLIVYAGATLMGSISAFKKKMT